TPNGHTIDSDRNHRYPSSSNIYHSAKGGGRIQLLAVGCLSRYHVSVGTASTVIPITGAHGITSVFEIF
ncbi:hypothetical protein, partial [Candidatus Igneacidithiobacillus taiwanensis]|uniref:hypothetical protein n=1 Tax=Candidatus Igneacidithiobacillus taiwanensis TaxID=1945924 RepID=UPI0028A08C25